MDSQESPLVSIVTPSYNQGKFIEETILSVKNQDYGKIEHLIIDGGSSDETLEILKSYDDVYNMDWISEEDNGQSHAIQKGLDRAKGSILTWLNSDDTYFYKNAVMKVVEWFRKFAEPDLVYGHAAKINEDNVLMRVELSPKFNNERLKIHNFITQPTCFWKSSVYEKYKINLNFDYSMDYEYWLRLATKNYSWHRIDKIIATDRNHLDRKIISNSEEASKETRALRNDYSIQQSTLKELSRKISSGKERIQGIGYLVDVLKKPESDFAFNLKRQHLLKHLKNQLWGKSKSLI